MISKEILDEIKAIVQSTNSPYGDASFDTTKIEEWLDSDPIKSGLARQSEMEYLLRKALVEAQEVLQDLRASVKLTDSPAEKDLQYIESVSEWIKHTKLVLCTNRDRLV